MTALRKRRGQPTMRTAERFTLVSFHAHPDDESLLTGGTLAKAAAEGHRVVLVTATCGERGLTGRGDGSGSDLARVRLRELSTAASLLGVARVISLGYGDSGLRADPSDRTTFAGAEVSAAARRLAEVLQEERADVLTIYDPNGGYGHPDHRQVHLVGAYAARLAGTAVVLEATVPAGLFRGALALLRVLRHPVGGSAPLGTAQVFSQRNSITHRVCVRRFMREKRAAMGAHTSQRQSDGQLRVMDFLLRLPVPVFGLAFGHEWFVEHGRVPIGRTTDIFNTLRTS